MKDKMITISECDDQYITEYFQKFKNTNLTILIDKFSDSLFFQLKAIGTELRNLHSLENLEIKIQKNTILQESGFKLIMEPLNQLSNLTELTIYINSLCIFESEGISELADALKCLQKLTQLTIKIGHKNIIQARVVKYLVDNLTFLKNLESLQLDLLGLRIRSDDTEDSLKNFWEGFSKLSQIKSLCFNLNYDYIGEEALMNLFTNIQLSGSQLTSFSIYLEDNDTRFAWLDKLVDILLLQLNLKDIIIKFNNEDYLSEKWKDNILNLITTLKNLSTFNCSKIQSNWTNQSQQHQSITKYLSLFQSLRICNLNSREIQMNVRNGLKDSFNLKSLVLCFDYEKQRIYDEFIDDICKSFRNMKQLAILKLVVRSEIGRQACKRFRESFQHLENLQSFDLIINHTFRRYPSLLAGLKYLVNLKEFKVYTHFYYDYSMQKVLLQNISTLQNLQTLELQQQKDIVGISNIKELSSTLHLLPNLLILNIKISLNRILSNQEIEEFQEALNTKNKLKQLKVELLVGFINAQYSNSQILARIVGLVKLEIFEFYINFFTQQFLTDFSDSLGSLNQLKSFNFFSEQGISSWQLINMLSALGCVKNLQKLTLKIKTLQEELDSEQQQEQEMMNLGESCKNLQKLQQLQIIDCGSKKQQFSFYFFGISKLVNLKILNIDCQSLMEDKDAEMLMNCFQQTSKLEVLKIKAMTCLDMDVLGENYFARGILALQKLIELKLYLTTSCYFSEQQRLFFQTNFISLPFLKTIEVKIDDEIQQIDNQKKVPKLWVESSFSNQEQISRRNIQLTSLDLHYNVEKNMDSEFLDQQLSLCNNIPYLYNFSLRIYSKEIIKFCLKNFVSCINSFTKLNNLKLQFEKLNFSENTYQELKTSLKNLSLLESLDYSQTEYTENDLHLYEGMVNLTNITNLTLSCPFSMAGTIALGLSLMKIPYLLTLKLDFLKSSIIGAEGAISIGNGLSTLKLLKKLTLHLNSDLPIQEIGATTIAEGIEKLSKLQILNMQIGQNLVLPKEGGYKLAHCISDLSVLIELNLIVNSNNNITSSFIEELVRSKQIKHLKKLNLKIEEIIGETNFPSELADILNLSQSQIKIEFLTQSLTISQGKNLNIKIVKLNLGKNPEFFRKLSTKLELQLSDDINANLTGNFIESMNNLILQIGQTQSKQLTINLGRNIDSSSISVLCENLSKLKHIESLCLEIRKNEPKKMITILQSLSWLSNLRYLRLEMIQDQSYTSENYFLLVKNLTKIPHLFNILITFGQTKIDKLLDIIIKRKLIRLVKLHPKNSLHFVKKSFLDLI